MGDVVDLAAVRRQRLVKDPAKMTPADLFNFVRRVMEQHDEDATAALVIYEKDRVTAYQLTEGPDDADKES